MAKTVYFLSCVACAVTALAQQVGQPAPPLTLEKLVQAPEGTKFQWEAMRGRPVVLEFWATWCGPCVGEIPHLNALASKFSNIQFISITDGDEQYVQTFLAKRPIAGWIGFDPDRSTFRAYNVEGIPHTVLVDANGIVRGVTHASGLSEAALTALSTGGPVSVPALAKHSTEPFKQALSEGPAPIVFVLIRPAADMSMGSFSSRNGSLEAAAWPLRQAIAYVNSTEASRVVGPETLMLRYDVAVRLPHGAEDVRGALRQLLSETFKLKVRRETRPTDVLVLRVQQNKLVESAGTGSSMSSSRGKGRWVGTQLSMLVKNIENMMSKPVIDETGKAGRYDFELEWNPDDPTSVRESLLKRYGLELVSTRRDVDYVVVDSLEPPMAR